MTTLLAQFDSSPVIFLYVLHVGAGNPFLRIYASVAEGALYETI